MKKRSKATILLIFIVIASVISMSMMFSETSRESKKASDAMALRKTKENNDRPTTTTTTKVAIFFESASGKLEDVSVVSKFMELLPDWKFQLFLTEESREQFEIHEPLKTGISSGRVILTIVPPFDKTWYMRIQLNVTFWENVVLGDFVLMFHPDSMICKESPHKIEDFFE